MIQNFKMLLQRGRVLMSLSRECGTTLQYCVSSSDQGRLLLKHIKPTDKLGRPQSESCHWLGKGVFPHVSQQGFFLSAQNVGNVITAKTVPS